MPRPVKGNFDGAVVSGFFVGQDNTRGHHPPLHTVEATKCDKRVELCLCLLSEHLSGQCKCGFVSVANCPLMNRLDKRELLSSVDKTVDKLPTDFSSGDLTMSANFLIRIR